MLSLAKANGVRRVLVPASSASVLRGVQEKRPVRLAGVEVVEVHRLKEVVLAMWGPAAEGSRAEGGSDG